MYRWFGSDAPACKSRSGGRRRRRRRSYRGGNQTGHAQTRGRRNRGNHRHCSLLLEIRSPTRVQHILNIFLHGDLTHINSTLTIRQESIAAALRGTCERSRHRLAHPGVARFVGRRSCGVATGVHGRPLALHERRRTHLVRVVLRDCGSGRGLAGDFAARRTR